MEPFHLEYREFYHLLQQIHQTLLLLQQQITTHRSLWIHQRAQLLG